MCKAIEELSKTAFEEGQEVGLEKGREEGREERSIEFAKDLLEIEKMPPEKVAKLTRLPLEKVLTLC